MAERTPSTVPTSSSRMAVGSVGAATGEAGTGGIAGATPRDACRGGAVQVVEWVECVAGSDGTRTVVQDRGPSMTALTFSIQSSYRHSRARLEDFLWCSVRALFFATASTLVEQMPTVTPESKNSVVILRVRGADEAGATLLDVLATYATDLRSVDSKLMLVTDNERVIRQLRVTGATEVIGDRNVYRSSAFLGETTRNAHADAHTWIEEHRTEIGDEHA